MAIEIVSLPLQNGDFPVGYVTVYQRVYPIKSIQIPLSQHFPMVFSFGMFTWGQLERVQDGHAHLRARTMPPWKKKTVPPRDGPVETANTKDRPKMQRGVGMSHVMLW